MNTEEISEEIEMSLSHYVNTIADIKGWTDYKADDFHDYMLGMTLAYLSGNVKITEVDMH